jgi:hypothetical protein
MRLAIGTLLSIALALWAGALMSRACLPVLQWVYAHLDTDNEVVSLELSDHGVIRGEDKVFTLTIAPRPYIYVGNQLIATNVQGRSRVSVLTAYLWQPFVVALPLILAWPARHRREWFARALVLFVGTFLVALIDLPTLIWSEVWSYYIDAVAPGKFSFLLSWGHLLKNGGQTLLGIVIASMGVCLGQAWLST